MGNYFSGSKITTHDTTISSECNIDIFVNKKSLDENIEIIESGLNELISEDVIQMNGDKLSQKRTIRDNNISL